jgi:hypothetical protein
MSNELVRVDNFESALVEIENTEKMCQKLLATKHYAKLGQEGIYAIVAKAKSLGVNPLEALNGGLYFVQGKVGMSGEMMASLIRQAGHSICKDPKSDEKCIILNGRRKDNGDTWQCSFSIDDAKRAGIYKNMWEKYPAVMAYNRCLSMLARQLFPDVIKGSGYTMDELKEIARNDPMPPMEQVETVELISDVQLMELSNLLTRCPEEYVESVMKSLSKMKVDSLEYLPVTMFDRIKLAAIRNVKQDVLIEEIIE